MISKINSTSDRSSNRKGNNEANLCQSIDLFVCVNARRYACASCNVVPCNVM